MHVLIGFDKTHANINKRANVIRTRFNTNQATCDSEKLILCDFNQTHMLPPVLDVCIPAAALHVNVHRQRHCQVSVNQLLRIASQ